LKTLFSVGEPCHALREELQLLKALSVAEGHRFSWAEAMLGLGICPERNLTENGGNVPCWH
jgi:hypothetical protein